MKPENSIISLIRNSLMIKLLVIGIILLLLLIPRSMIQGIINERSERKNDVIEDISSKWGKEQYLYGPLLIIPYNERSAKGELVSVKELYLLPATLTIDCSLLTQKRKRGIYSCDVYTAETRLSGSFALAPKELEKLNIPMEDLRIEESLLLLGIDDIRGIKNKITASWNSSSIDFEPSSGYSDISSSTLESKVAFDPGKEEALFSIELDIAGSKDFRLIPLATQNSITMSGTFGSPHFSGNTLPDNYSINESDFTAAWSIYNQYSSYPKIWNNRVYPVKSDSFGVSLFNSVDEYQKSTRSIKYSVLFVTLLFTAYFFLFEIIYRKQIHPVQYFFTGSLLTLFYLLLISISEHLSFNMAYAISSAGVVGVTWCYVKGIMGFYKPALLISLILGGIFSFLFIPLQLEDYSLLCGSAGLFLILASLMLYTRKINWYTMTAQTADQAK